MATCGTVCWVCLLWLFLGVVVVYGVYGWFVALGLCGWFCVVLFGVYDLYDLDASRNLLGCLIDVCCSACFDCLTFGCSLGLWGVLCGCLSTGTLCLTFTAWFVGCLLGFCIALWFVFLLSKVHC